MTNIVDFLKRRDERTQAEYTEEYWEFVLGMREQLLKVANELPQIGAGLTAVSQALQDYRDYEHASPDSVIPIAIPIKGGETPPPLTVRWGDCRMIQYHYDEDTREYWVFEVVMDATDQLGFPSRIYQSAKRELMEWLKAQDDTEGLIADPLYSLVVMLNTIEKAGFKLHTLTEGKRQLTFHFQHQKEILLVTFNLAELDLLTETLARQSSQ